MCVCVDVAYTYTYTTLIRHASRAGIRSDRFASNSQYARSSLDEQVGLSMPRGCVDSAQQKDISANKQKTAKKKNNNRILYCCPKEVMKSIVKIKTVLRQ